MFDRRCFCRASREGRGNFSVSLPNQWFDVIFYRLSKKCINFVNKHKPIPKPQENPCKSSPFYIKIRVCESLIYFERIRMSKKNRVVPFVFYALLVLLCPLTSKAQDPSGYVVTAANEKLTFLRQPELGYVVKTKQKTFNIEALSGALQLFTNAEIKPIRGLDRKIALLTVRILDAASISTGPKERIQY